MSIRLDPRRLGALKLLAAEAGVRPGELVTRWVEERLDAARAGRNAPSAVAPDALAGLTSRVDELYRRLDQILAPAQPAATPTAEAATDVAAPVKRGRGRPRKVVDGAAALPTGKPARRSAIRGAAGSSSKIALHDEIAAVIAERGPQSAADLAEAITERGRYHAPRSAKPLDAAAVNARVSNPTYRARFLRREHRIGLAAE